MAEVRLSAVIWLSPVLGAAAYVALGINRIRRKGEQLRAGMVRAEGR